MKTVWAVCLCSYTTLITVQKQRRKVKIMTVNRTAFCGAQLPVFSYPLMQIHIVLCTWISIGYGVYIHLRCLYCVTCEARHKNLKLSIFKVLDQYTCVNQFKRLLPLVKYTLNYWVSGFCSLTVESTTFWRQDMFPPSGEKVGRQLFIWVH